MNIEEKELIKVLKQKIEFQDKHIRNLYDTIDEQWKLMAGYKKIANELIESIKIYKKA